MKTIKFNDLQLSPVCLGAMNFGTTTSESDAFKVLDAFIDAGGNFIDTSNNYAHWAGTGDESETCLGKWLASRKIRDKVVIATKVGFDRHGEGAGLRPPKLNIGATNPSASSASTRSTSTTPTRTTPTRRRRRR